MEQSKERNFVCKFCRKRFPCGKSLGGHIRTHAYENSVDSEEDETNKLKIGDNGGLSSYGLRENPKKNKRFVDQSEMNASIHQHQLLLCRECGKRFNSSKALCGHMACHSDKEKTVLDSHSDTETSSVPIRRRSRRMMKHQKGLVFGSTINQSNSASFADGNSSSLSEIEQEQEELAMCLMMLSRDSSFKKGHNLVVNSVAESSDNNSVIVETKSSSGELKIMMNVNNVGGFCYNADVNIKKQGNDKQLKSTEDNAVLLYDSDNTDSGYFRKVPKKVGSEAFVDGFLESSGFNKGAMEYGSKFNDLQTKQNKNKFKNAIESGGASTKYDLRKSKRVCSYDPQKNSKKHELKSNNEFTESVYDSGENSMEANSCAHTKPSSSSSKHTTASAAFKKAGAKKKSKGHECPICFRVFKSGQALGGHKRSHFIGNQDNSTVVIQQDVTEMHTLIDLNLPAPLDE